MILGKLNCLFLPKFDLALYQNNKTTEIHGDGPINAMAPAKQVQRVGYRVLVHA
jgi:hypothetical protein